MPLKIYFNARGRAKLELALARGKQLHDKRESEKQRTGTARRAACCASETDIQFQEPAMSHAPPPNLSALPADLPIPEDDGGAAHLVGLRFPDLALPATEGCVSICRTFLAAPFFIFIR